MATNPRSTQELFQANPKKRNLTVDRKCHVAHFGIGWKI